MKGDADTRSSAFMQYHTSS